MATDYRAVCAECGAPADSVSGHSMEGVDFDGSDATFWVDSVVCAAGHRYDLVDEAKTVKR